MGFIGVTVMFTVVPYLLPAFLCYYVLMPDRCFFFFYQRVRIISGKYVVFFLRIKLLWWWYQSWELSQLYLWNETIWVKSTLSLKINDENDQWLQCFKNRYYSTWCQLLSSWEIFKYDNESDDLFFLEKSIEKFCMPSQKKFHVLRAL